QVGGRPLSAVTPEKTMETPSRSQAAAVDDEGAQQLREAGGAAMPPDLTMKCIVEAWNVLPGETRSELKRLLIESETSSGVPGGDSAGGSLVENEASFQPLNGYDYAKPEPLARAPKNVFVFRGKEQQVLGWRNVYDLPIQYDVELCPGLLSPESATLSNRFRPEDGPSRRFVVIGE
ncbi:unnamed protein product, partial [Ectocarpus fasciculatus]